MSVVEASNSIEQAKHGGDHSSRAAQLLARETEQKALSLWIKGATFQQIVAAGFGIELYLCRQQERSAAPVIRTCDSQKLSRTRALLGRTAHSVPTFS